MNKFYVYVHRRASDNLPFYVGKGKDKRAWNFHARSKFWNNTKAKHGVIVEIVFEDLSEEEAFQCEKDTILEFRYFGYPLVNLTDGGEGASGLTPSEITKQIKSRIGLARAEEFRQHAKTQWENYSAEEREERLAHLAEVRNNELAREKISSTSKERWADPEYRGRLSETQKISQRKRSAEISCLMKQKWQDENFRAMMQEKRRIAREKKLAEKADI